MPIFFVPGPRAAPCCLEAVAMSGGGSALCRCASGAPGSRDGKRCPKKKIPFQITLMEERGVTPSICTALFPEKM